MINVSVTGRAAGLFLLFTANLLASDLKPATDRYYLDHLKSLEQSMANRPQFLLIDKTDGLRKKVHEGFVHIKDARAEKEPPDGIIHHWEGAVFLPGVTVQQVLTFVQNYDAHKVIYSPEVMDSKLLKHDGNHFDIRLRLYKKKVITAVLETEHSVDYKQVSPTRWESVSHTTKVSEVDHPGTAKESEQPPGHGYGFVWRLDSYWRFEEADGGVYMEVTSMTLSRNVPFGMGRLIRPIIDELPVESLRGILTKTRANLKPKH